MDDQKTMQAIQVVQQRQPRPRFHFTEEHLSLLEGIYQQAKYPDKSQKVKAAGAIGATESQVNEWFQRRRKKEMKLQRESGVINTPTATTTVPFINVTAENNNEHNTETTSTYFPPFDGSVNASIPDHEVYVYIDAPQQNQENMYGAPANLLPSTELQYYNNFMSNEYIGNSNNNNNNNAVNSNNFVSSSTSSIINTSNFASNSSIINNMSNNFVSNSTSNTNNNMTSINNFSGNYGTSNSYDNNIIASVKIDDESRKASSSTSSNQTAENNESRELIASIMSYLNPDLGLISAEVVRDFLKKVKDTSPNTRGVILHIIKQTHDPEILKSLVRERVSYILRNWIKEEATKTEDNNNLKELLEIVSLLPIDYKLSRSSGLGTVIYNKNVKESTIDGVAKLAGGLLDKWVEEKKLSEEQQQLKEQKALEEKKRLDKAEKIIQKVGSKSDLVKSSTSQTSFSSGKELARPPKPDQKRKKVADGNAQNDNEKPSIFTQLLSNLAASASKRQPRPPQKDPSKLVPPSKLKIEKQVTQSQQMEITEEGPSTQKHKEPETLPTPSKKRKRVTFAPDGLLEKVKLFEIMELEDTDEEPTTADTPHHYGNARDLDRNEGRAAFKRVRKAPAIQWHTPITIDFSSRPKIKKRKFAESDEAKIQEERERQILETIYITSDQVPFSPAEPLQNAQINKFGQSVPPKEFFLEANKENIKNEGYKDIDILDLNGGYNEEVLRVLYQIYPQWEAMQNKKSMMIPINVPDQNVRGMMMSFSAPPPQSQAAPPPPIAPWGFNGNLMHYQPPPPPPPPPLHHQTPNIVPQRYQPQQQSQQSHQPQSQPQSLQLQPHQPQLQPQSQPHQPQILPQHHQSQLQPHHQPQPHQPHQSQLQIQPQLQHQPQPQSQLQPQLHQPQPHQPHQLQPHQPHQLQPHQPQPHQPHQLQSHQPHQLQSHQPQLHQHQPPPPPPPSQQHFQPSNRGNDGGMIRPNKGRGSECWYYTRGKCNMGDECKFLHIDH